MARPRKASKVLGSLDDCREAMVELLSEQVALEKSQGDLDEAVTRLRSSYEQELCERQKTIADIELQLQQYYMAHLKEIEVGGRKSVNLLHGVMGRRTLPASLKLLNKAWTWPAALIRLREEFGDRFLRKFEPEIDKDAVKDGLAEERLAEFGLKLDQPEKFYVDLNREARTA